MHLMASYLTDNIRKGCIVCKDQTAKLLLLLLHIRNWVTRSGCRAGHKLFVWCGTSGEEGVLAVR